MKRLIYFILGLFFLSMYPLDKAISCTSQIEDETVFEGHMLQLEALKTSNHKNSDNIKHINNSVNYILSALIYHTRFSKRQQMLLRLEEYVEEMLLYHADNIELRLYGIIIQGLRLKSTGKYNGKNYIKVKETGQILREIMVKYPDNIWARVLYAGWVSEVYEMLPVTLDRVISKDDLDDARQIYAAISIKHPNNIDVMYGYSKLLLRHWQHYSTDTDEIIDALDRVRMLQDDNGFTEIMHCQASRLSMLVKKGQMEKAKNLLRHYDYFR